MRHHKLALCQAHFLDWVPEQVERSIRRYDMFSHSDRVLVAVSGGKDSLSLWDILTRLGYTADGLYIGLGIDEAIQYSHNSHQFARSFAERNALHLHIVDIPSEYGESLTELGMR